MSLVIGFDVSKKKLAQAVFDGKKYEITEIDNTKTAITACIKRYKSQLESVIMVMEATGTYHLKLATMLYEAGFKVAVVNPLIIKRYSEMKMARVKTDFFDAKQIAKYGFDYCGELRLFTPSSEAQQQMIKILRAMEDLEQTTSQYRNRIEALSQDPVTFELVASCYKTVINEIAEKMKKLNLALQQLMQEHYADNAKLLQSIPGVGPKTSAVIIAFFGEFENFETSRQVISFCGTNPSPKESGSSIKGRGKISKKGKKYLRKQLYMSTVSAAQHNNSCKELYQRLTKNGHENRQARVAVINKLIRQIFAIMKSKKFYDENYNPLCAQN